MGFISPPLRLLLFSSRCAAAGISGDSLAALLQSSSLPAAMATAECLAAERSNGCGMRERSRPKQKWKKRTRERESKEVRVCSLALIQSNHNAETEMRLLAGHQVSENKDVCASNAGNWGPLGSMYVFPSTFALEARHSSFQACKEDYGKSERRGRETD